MMRKLSVILSFVILSPILSPAQTAGGVEGCEAWMVTTPTSIDLNGTYRWLDISGDSVPLRHVAGVQAGQEVVQSRDSVQTFNFHPALRFSPQGGFMDAVLQHSRLGRATIVGMFAPDTLPDSDNRIIATMGNDGKAATRDKTFHSGDTTTLDYSPDLLHGYAMSTSPKVFCWQWAQRPKHSPWGEATGASLSLGGGTLEGNASFTAAISGLGDREGFCGWCPELLVFGRMLTPWERVRVESYLALKYGISLDGSYFYRNLLLWDVDDIYQHRVTGIIRDLREYLHIPISTTSYEESPRASILPSNDSHFRRDSYGMTSAYRLLAMGRIFSDDHPQLSYMMWGDNGGPIHTTSSEGGWHTMERNWMVRTNIDTASVHPQQVAHGGMDVSADGHLYTLRGSPVSSSWATFGPETSGDMHMSFVHPWTGADFSAGITLFCDTTCYHGYHFHSDGRVARIVSNVEEATPILTDVRGHSIDIWRRGDNLFLQVNGKGDATYNIVVPLSEPGQHGIWDEDERSASDTSNSDASADNVYESIPERDVEIWPTRYSCIGVVQLAPGDTLSGLRVEGFGDTGSYAELGYDIAGEEFKSHRLGRSWLLASGASGTRAFRCAGFDPERKKILFHNLAFADRDTLTFAWNDRLMADVDAEEATCGLLDGRVNIHVHASGPVLTYMLTDMPTRSGVGEPYPESTRDLAISGLRPGTYYLTLIQKNMQNLHAWPIWPVSQRERMVASLPGNTFDFSWSYNGFGTGNAYVAGVSLTETSVIYGVKVRNDTAWVVKNGQLLTPMPVTNGTPFRVRYASKKVYVTIGDNQTTISATKTSQWSFLAQFSQGFPELRDFTGLTASPTYSSDRVMMETVAADTLRYEVHIGSSCDGDTYVIPLDGGSDFTFRLPRDMGGGPASPSSPLKISSTPQGSLTFTATFSPAIPEGSVELLVFDAAGRLHRRGKVFSSPPCSETFTVDAPGVYLVKAVTESGEYGCKVACGTP